ncbi:hypothetical protein TVAG_181040 [Trichomonas vaginalis G3]|uniref:Uncharacterized protein n=1 Tax=Trichomonas vaginalis (strain ATCC PRA-98 / G3) TaxID=412133 RepID=A2F3B7_TRIV3|nr:hypothetical protein TVAGG3_1028150 [Trichomonas vaginalis G3]EAY00626.1 hypothetical protein TVAG_181040 [Trichomonas vaginalis G3]KAI5492658.1 hypothetical protein TVAGG3_1028150 [Trichomonas vaginalis G3]|eukprot:XP_001313555.1 hypothetical protein [Trichomonas vaginalis G3]
MSENANAVQPNKSPMLEAIRVMIENKKYTDQVGNLAAMYQQLLKIEQQNPGAADVIMKEILKNLGNANK